eukprot:GCRY01001887.1.p1 GENE.GCRY01001887.1~~GCRY01001887.1.p1  ORF type:complete len:106 (-),score=4.81 GCRY01001887.1:24-341(-)
MLYLVGLGLADEKDITVKGLEAVKKCKRVYLEAYTSILGVEKEKLEKYYEREIILADRDLVEQGSDEMLKNAKNEDRTFCLEKCFVFIPLLRLLLIISFLLITHC